MTHWVPSSRSWKEKWSITKHHQSFHQYSSIIAGCFERIIGAQEALSRVGASKSLGHPWNMVLKYQGWWIRRQLSKPFVNSSACVVCTSYGYGCMDFWALAQTTWSITRQQVEAGTLGALQPMWKWKAQLSLAHYFWTIPLTLQFLHVRGVLQLALQVAS